MSIRVKDMLQRFKVPKDNNSYEWTRHAVEKMMHYRMGEGLIKRVIRSPQRKEEGVALGTTAVMKPTNSRHSQEYWVMYKDISSAKKKVISAWRYPGQSPVGASIPIPDDIKEELERINI